MMDEGQLSFSSGVKLNVKQGRVGTATAASAASTASTISASDSMSSRWPSVRIKTPVDGVSGPGGSWIRPGMDGRWPGVEMESGCDRDGY